jgi:hypothetical protein
MEDKISVLNARTLEISAGACRLMEECSIMGRSVSFQLTELSRLSSVRYRRFYCMPESLLSKVTCYVTSQIFLVVVLSCSRWIFGCQGQETMYNFKSLTKNIEGYRDMWVTQLWLRFTVFCYKTPSSLAEIYKYFERNLVRLSSTLSMLAIF